jgi:catechol 2,3-dioxygenase-like lactoylglutathione lyase family enzyme
MTKFNHALGLRDMSKISFDHCVIHVTNWDKSNAFYRDIVGAEVVPNGKGWAYRFGSNQLNLHGPGLDPHPMALLPVQPGNSDLCFAWDGPIEEAVAHLTMYNINVEVGPVARSGAQGPGTSVYFRDPDGSLLEFISYHHAT